MSPTEVHLPFPPITLNGATMGEAADAARVKRQQIDALAVSDAHKDGLHGIVDSFNATLVHLAARTGEPADNVKVSAFVNGATNGAGSIMLSDFRVSVMPAVGGDPAPEPTADDEVVPVAPVARKKR